MEQAIGDKSQFCRISSKTVSTLNALTNEGSMMFYMSKKFPWIKWFGSVRFFTVYSASTCMITIAYIHMDHERITTYMG